MTESPPISFAVEKHPNGYWLSRQERGGTPHLIWLGPDADVVPALHAATRPRCSRCNSTPAMRWHSGTGELCGACYALQLAELRRRYGEMTGATG